MSASFVPEYQESRLQPTMQLLSVNCPITFELLAEGGGSTYYFAFYLTFISLRMTYRKYCQKKMFVSEHLLYTQIKNISMHIIINES